MYQIIRYLIVGSLSLALQSFCLASHNRAGEITYQWMSGYTYKITVVTYTKESSPADRCELEIAWGDDKIDTILRVNGLMDS